uniref:Uncharacterized protein n=1 Tax=Oryza punctata TaxID=4537 RepID=A0A0E0KKK1_ORYPU
MAAAAEAKTEMLPEVALPEAKRGGLPAAMLLHSWSSKRNDRTASMHGAATSRCHAMSAACPRFWNTSVASTRRARHMRSNLSILRYLLQETSPAHLVDAASDEAAQHMEVHVDPKKEAVVSLPERAAVAVDELLDVRVRPAGDDRQPSPLSRPRRGARCLASEVGGRELIIGARHADQMVRHAGALLLSHLVQLMTSPPNRRARSTARRDFPVPVAPITTTALCFTPAPCLSTGTAASKRSLSLMMVRGSVSEVGGAGAATAMYACMLARCSAGCSRAVATTRMMQTAARDTSRGCLWLSVPCPLGGVVSFRKENAVDECGARNHGHLDWRGAEFASGADIIIIIK